MNDFEEYRLQGQPQARQFLQRVDWPWIEKAARLPGKALHVALVIQLLAGMVKRDEVDLGAKYLKRIGVDRHAKYRALKRLEEAGLVSVKGRQGKWPKVRVLRGGI